MSAQPTPRWQGTSLWGFILGLLCLMGPASETRAGTAELSLYAKRDSWAESMLAARTQYARWREEAAKQTAPSFQPFDSGRISGEGPGRAISANVTGLPSMRLVTTLLEGAGNLTIWGEARLIAKDGTETKLSSLKPMSVSVGWGELHADRNWQNQPLQVADKQLKHGIWVHASSEVCYVLGGRYERFEAWIGIDRARATGAARFQVLAGTKELLPGLWQQLAADFPAQAKWLTQDAPNGQHLRWFAEDTGVKLEQDVIGRAFSAAGPAGEPLRKELAELARAKAAPSDPRWLNLYARACRYRDCAASLSKVWIADLQRLLDSQAAELLRPEASPDDPRWAGLAACAARIAEVPGRRMELASRATSLTNLAKAFPGRWAGAELAGRLDQQARRWQELLLAVAGGHGAAPGPDYGPLKVRNQVPSVTSTQEAALKELPAILKEIQDSERAVLMALRPMAEFLALPANAGMEKEWESQFAALQADIANRGHLKGLAPETLRQDALILDSDRDPADVVLRRTVTLLADLKRLAGVRLDEWMNGGMSEQRTPAVQSSIHPIIHPSNLPAALEAQLAELQAASRAIAPKDFEARYILFADACRVRRQIAFRNPLVNFGELLFVKHHRALYDHMCDQYYGMAARPGGGLYVLSDPFGANPRVRDVLANSVVERGRLKGQKISGGPNKAYGIHFDGMGNQGGAETEGGSFLSPDLSYDGKSILFAYVECRGDRRHVAHTDPSRGHWSEGRTYHVFRVGVDGSGLQQLTDGTWNDFDPIWLPNGRIAFMSERRGGYLRCGRCCPTYTLYGMAADGSDIRCLSYHETNEWHPSVTNDGRIAWTRWDYVDRHFSAAHMPWFTTLDGREPRPIHGNYGWRGGRADMELSLRAVPDSRKFVATAAPHHGQAYGSLLIIDPEMRDDDRMSPVKRLTPEVNFPETQGGTETYGTAWPLSEDYHLCVYDAATRPGGRGHAGANYGIYLVDSFGNKELVYRDPEIACLRPIPLRPRPMPVVVPDGSVALAAHQPPEATVSVLNVYDSLKAWPEGTVIKGLRVWQILPLSVAPCPRNTGLQVPGTGSVNCARAVLGTVPVESDGSAHFIVPAGKEIFFQALDEKGLAVQSMRSGTHLQPGEQAVCQGCHEPRGRAPLLTTGRYVALQRPPSRLTPDVDGTNPFSYPRLVQPVLNKYCLDCHTKNPEKAPRLDTARVRLEGRAYMDLTTVYYASYVSLAPKYGFYSYGGGGDRSHRTTPGEFGARGSKLLAMLLKGHHDVKLPPEDLHRIAVWLDSCSLFYGVYEPEGGEAQLRGEIVRPTLE